MNPNLFACSMAQYAQRKFKTYCAGMYAHPTFRSPLWMIQPGAEPFIRRR